VTVFRLTTRKRCGTRPKPCRWLSGQWKCYEVVRGRLVVRFLGRRWHGLTALSGVRDGTSLSYLPGESTYATVIEMKKKKVGGGANGPVHLAPMESVLLGAHHSIVAHMATLKYDDGDPRRPGEFRIRPAGAMWVAEALDYDARCSLQCVQATLDDAVAGLALLLEADDAPWQPCSWMKEPPAPRKKK